MTEQIDWREKQQAQIHGHHTVDRLEERGAERENARRSSLETRDRSMVSQMNIGTGSKATLGKPVRDGVERIKLYGLFQTYRYQLQQN